MYESAENGLKENNNVFSYLFDVKFSWIFSQNMNVDKLPPLLLNGLPTVTITGKLKTVKLVSPDQPAQNTLPQRHFFSLLG